MSKRLRKTKSLKLLMLLAFAIIVVFVILSNFPSETGPSPTTTTTTTLPPTTTTMPVSKGTLIIAFKDEDQKIPGGAVLKSMNFTVTGIEVYDESGEWVSVLDGEKTLDLLKYTTTLAQIGEKEIDAGTYGKIKMGFSDGSVSLTNTFLYIYRPRVYDLIVPNETIVEYEFNITDGGTLTLTLDFDIWNSVSHIAEGYMLDPVIIVSEEVGSATNMEEI